MTTKIVSGIILDERAELSLNELCRACATSSDWIIELIDEGVLEPIGQERTQWRFSGISLQRARTARRLQSDLRINLAGVALALELMDEIAALRERLGRFETD